MITIKDNVSLLLLISPSFFIREIIIDFYIVMYIAFVTFLDSSRIRIKFQGIRLM